MLINNKSLDYFGISLVTIFDLEPSDYKIYGQSWNTNQIVPIGGFHSEDFRTLNIELLFEGNSKEELIKKISIFTEEIKTCTIKRNNLFYDIKLNGKLSTKQINPFAITVSHNFIVSDVYETEKSIKTNTSKTITINSPKSCYANLEISANTNVISAVISINGTEITIKNIKGNETVYIGSGKVIANGKSKIEDVDIWELPILNPGTNRIVVNRSDVNLIVKYCERW